MCNDITITTVKCDDKVADVPVHDAVSVTIRARTTPDPNAYLQAVRSRHAEKSKE